MTGENLLELKSFKNIKLLAGENGLMRSVSWGYPMHIEEFEPWVRGGEVLLISGYLKDFDNEALLHVLERAAALNLSGIMIEKGEKITYPSQEVIDMANEKRMPLFFSPEDISFADIAREIANYISENRIVLDKQHLFLEKMFELNSPTEKSVHELAQQYGVTLKKKKEIALFYSVDDSDYRSARAPLSILSYTIRTFLQTKRLPVTIYSYSDCIALMLTADTQNELNKMEEYCKDFYNLLLNVYAVRKPLLTFGRPTERNLGILKSMQDAVNTMDLLKKGVSDKKIAHYWDLGSFQLISEINNTEGVIDFRNQVLWELWNYDKSHSSQLMLTLERYLQNNGNTAKTANDLVVHRNTLIYRLERIAELSNRNLEDPFDRRDFMNAIMISSVYPFEE